MTLQTDHKFAEQCRSFGWRCTSQRLAVHQYLQGNSSHPDIDTVWHGVKALLPSITRESVYRIMNEFCEKGLLERVDQIDYARYDTRIGPHGHLICEKCGKITDFDWPAGIELPPGLVDKTVHHMEIRLVGLCKECASRQGKAGVSSSDESLSKE